MKGAIGNAQEYHMQPADGAYQCLAIDFCLCHFDHSSARRGAQGCVVNARFLRTLPMDGKGNLDAVCKVVDVLR